MRAAIYARVSTTNHGQDVSLQGGAPSALSAVEGVDERGIIRIGHPL